ncbi:alginate lyase family protein [Spongiivirga citrea]|uniref:Alginate lyase domain-containing protein n=1 Tax=Spongiivirga citrea TaxID=1481457 RepID=A0A6M0CIY6_9FLAO|nr:alginate lyase family protein [Spongiivirga citrea]NER17811.1 hypothetical protein [Spongiivirga citrea]
MKRRNFKDHLLVFCIVSSLFIHVSVTGQNRSNKSQRGLTNIDFQRLEEIKQNMQEGEVPYKKILKKLLKKADKKLQEGVFSVVYKKQKPVSGDKHDYLSLGPYWWPDPDKADGLPWIRRDGEINPLTRDSSTDLETKNKMFSNTSTLAFAYYFSGKNKYAKKTIELLETWFINTNTKMNPNLNYAQGIPGRNNGRGIGIIEFAGISNVITAIELLELENKLDQETSSKLRKWFEAYLKWLQTSKNGIFEKNTKNNHATYYDAQVISIMLFLDKEKEAKEVLEAAKTTRIAKQIEADGKQPHELERTKSLSYSTMNLSGFTTLAYFGKKLGVDLWSYTAENGGGIQMAYQFLKPYASGEKNWNYQQIHSEQKARKRLKLLFNRAGSIFNDNELCSVSDIKPKSIQELLYTCQ